MKRALALVLLLSQFFLLSPLPTLAQVRTQQAAVESAYTGTAVMSATAQSPAWQRLPLSLTFSLSAGIAGIEPGAAPQVQDAVNQPVVVRVAAALMQNQGASGPGAAFTPDLTLTENGRSRIGAGILPQLEDNAKLAGEMTQSRLENASAEDWGTSGRKLMDRILGRRCVEGSSLEEPVRPDVSGPQRPSPLASSRDRQADPKRRAIGQIRRSGQPSTQQRPGKLKHFLAKVPFLTVGIMLLNIMAFGEETIAVDAGSSLDAVASAWGLVPSHIVQAFAVGDLAVLGQSLAGFVSYMFVHGSLQHLQANIASLLCWGPMIESALGRKRALGLYLASGIAGAVAWFLANAASAAPLIGASAAVAGFAGAALVLLVRKWRSLPPLSGALSRAQRWKLLAQRLLVAANLLFFFAPLLAIPQLKMMLDWLGQNNGIAYLTHAVGLLAGMLLLRLFAKGAAAPALSPPRSTRHP